MSRYRPPRLRPRFGAGLRFGALVVVECIGTTDRGHVYRLRCDCGGEVERPARYLRTAVESGRRPSCDDCIRKTHRRVRPLRRAIQRKLFLAWWEDWRLLYPPGWDELETAALADALELEPAPPTPRELVAVEPARSGARIESIDHAMTLQEIADELGLTRERVRQIEAEALAKLRRALEAEERAEARRTGATPRAPIDWAAVSFRAPLLQRAMDDDERRRRVAAAEYERKRRERLRREDEAARALGLDLEPSDRLEQIRRWLDRRRRG